MRKYLREFFVSSLSVIVFFMVPPTALKANEGLSKKEAEIFLDRNSKYFSKNCLGSTTFECAGAYAAIVYIRFYSKDYSAANEALRKFPSYLPNSFTNCDSMWWTTHPNSRGGKGFSIDRWAAISVLNKKLGVNPKNQPEQYTHAYLCKALNESLAFGPAPNDEFPVEAAEFVDLAPKYLPKKEAATLAKFEQEIAIPYRSALADINRTHIPADKPSPKNKRIKAIALKIELQKNAISEASRHGFPIYYINWMKDAQAKTRHSLQLEEKTR